MKSMIRLVIRSAAVAAVVAGAGTAGANEVRPMLKLGYDTGGDTLVTVVFINGERRSIKANEGFYFGGGMSLVSDDKTLEGELTLSYKFQSIKATNGDVTWSRFPLEGLVFYRFPKVRVGGGFTYHLNPKLAGGGVVSGLSTNFNNAFGSILEGDYRLTEKMNLGLRFTFLNYTVGGASASSNGVGINFSGSF
jgi:hypothetical protein